MAVIHICDRCGQETRYDQVGPTKQDPLGQKGVEFTQLQGFCADCLAEQDRLGAALQEYVHECGVAWAKKRSQPSPPELW